MFHNKKATITYASNCALKQVLAYALTIKIKIKKKHNNKRNSFKVRRNSHQIFHSIDNEWNLTEPADSILSIIQQQKYLWKSTAPPATQP